MREPSTPDVTRRNVSTKGEFEESVANFMRERVEFYLRDVRGFAYDVVNAVLAAGSDDVVDAIARAEAVSEVRGSEDFVSISIAFKRIKNIVRQARGPEKDEGTVSVGIEFNDPEIFEAGAERDLAMLIVPFLGDVKQLAAEKKYREALARVAALRRPVDTFFDKVMVMVDDEDTRKRRVLMLFFLLAGVSDIADFSEIVTEGK